MHTIILRLFWILSGTIQMSQYQKGKSRKEKNQSGFTGARDSDWHWHLLGHMQICTSPQITTPTSHHSVFYRLDAIPATQPPASKHWRHATLYTTTFPVYRLLTTSTLHWIINSTSTTDTTWPSYSLLHYLLPFSTNHKPWFYSYLLSCLYSPHYPSTH